MIAGQINPYTALLGHSDGEAAKPAVSPATLKAILADMGFQDDFDVQRWEEKREQRILPEVKVVRLGHSPITVDMTIPETDKRHVFHWQLKQEHGLTHQGTFVPECSRYTLPLPLEPQAGYHRFEVWMEGGDLSKTSMSLIAAPPKCHIPEPQRIWGPSVQLDALRSRQNWGIGDFSNLATLVEWSAEQGANIIGLNPLHAMFSTNVPSSRLNMNLLYLDVEAIPEFSTCEEARRLVFSDVFQTKLNELRQSEQVDYEGIAVLKRQVLEKLYQTFRPSRAQAFKQFVSQRGESLYRFALFEALQERFRQDNPDILGWRDWPEPFHDVAGEAVQTFAESHQERVEFYQYIQWVISEQLQGVGNLCLKHQLSIGLYMDLAAGLHPDGADVWANPSLFALHMTVGSPPTEENPKGQRWNIPPLIPHRLQQMAYRPFIELLHENMHYAGALQIDHILGLMRLFWIPQHRPAKEGAYIYYPMDDLVGFVAL